MEEGELLSYNDVDTVANDELLRPYLGVNADSRLKNIIATIQTEQNRIIREDMGKNLIVQGVAGSGKTTVALHRIAYLVYNNRDTVKPGQYMVIGPNQFFISYISAVLPDLDVDSVPQHTYASLAAEVLEEAFTPADASLRLAQVLADKCDGTVERHKTSMAYKAALDRFLYDFEQGILPEGGFDLRGFVVLDEEDLREGWKRGQESPGDSVRARVEHCILYLSGLVENRSFLLDNRLSAHFKELYGGSGASLDQLHRDRARIEKELAEGCKKALWKFFGKAATKPFALYRLFLQSCERYLDPAFPHAARLKKQGLAALRSRQPDSEDLAALLYLKERMAGRELGKWREFRHVVVDEAQDFGEFELYALQKVLAGSTFTVVGDLAQSVYGYRSVESWEPVRRHAFDRGAVLWNMEKCYRTTVEVMEAANRVTDQLGLPPAQPVIRHGPPVGLHRAEGAQAAALAGRLIHSFLGEGFQSVAVLCKTAEELEEACALLGEGGTEVQAVGTGSGRYGGGVCVMTGYLAKGLEFDGVILWDASEKIYSGERKTDLHLLYVAMTRPLHRLEILCAGEPCAPLRKLEENG